MSRIFDSENKRALACHGFFVRCACLCLSLLGGKVVSRRLPICDILCVNGLVQRRVTIWDNLNANDYDQRRLFLGPFSGRSSNLSSRISGMFLNPNCELEVNFVPLHTLGQWFCSLKINDKQQDNDDEDLSIEEQSEEVYQVEEAFHRALIDWLPEFNKNKSADGCSLLSENSAQAMSPKSSIGDDDSQDDSLSENSAHRIHTMEFEQSSLSSELTLADLRLLVELFYLPYEHGNNVQQMLMDFHWLRFRHEKVYKIKSFLSFDLNV